MYLHKVSDWYCRYQPEFYSVSDRKGYWWYQTSLLKDLMNHRLTKYLHLQCSTTIRLNLEVSVSSSTRSIGPENIYGSQKIFTQTSSLNETSRALSFFFEVAWSKVCRYQNSVKQLKRLILLFWQLQGLNHFSPTLGVTDIVHCIYLHTPSSQIHLVQCDKWSQTESCSLLLAFSNANKISNQVFCLCFSCCFGLIYLEKDGWMNG